MSNKVQELSKKGLLNAPDFVVNQLQFLVMMGSQSYGTNNEDSDIDLYGFTIPEKDVVFPHLAGEVEGFGRNKQRFEQYSEHHIFDKDAHGGKGQEYDITVYNITKYFMLLMENNPNIIDSLFVPQNCLLFCTPIGIIVRENRKKFLHKGSWHKFKGYAFSQKSRLFTKNPVGKRAEKRDENGLDRKFLYHIVRLLNEIEQILIEGDLDLMRSNRQLISVRDGEFLHTAEEIEEWFAKKESELETLYTNCTILPYGPDENFVKELLLDCLEQHFGSLSKAVVRQDKDARAIREIREILARL